MMGLMIKDLKLLKMQKNFIFIMIAICAMFLFTGNDVTFVISYLTFMSSFLIVSTISYDEYNQSQIFLFTLPVSRKEYVIQKYALGFVVCAGTWLVSTIVCTIYKISIVPEFLMIDWLQTCFLILCIPLFMLSFMLPTQLKYGGERGRVAMIVVMAACFGIGFVVVQFVKAMNIDLETFLSGMSNIGVAIGVAGITVISYAISYFISVKVMRNKQF